MRISSPRVDTAVAVLLACLVQTGCTIEELPIVETEVPIEYDLVFLDEGGKVLDHGYSFPTVAEGESVERAISLKNRGAEPVKLSRLSLGGDGGFEAEADLPKMLAPGEALEVGLLYRASKVGQFYVKVEAGLEKPALRVAELTLEVEVVERRCRVSVTGAGTSLYGMENVYDFGKVAPGDSQEAEVVIQNRSPASWMIGVGQFAGGEGAFSIVDEALVDGQISVPANGSVAIKVLFAPEGWGTSYLATLPLVSAHSCNISEVLFAGEGRDRLLVYDWMVDFGDVDPGLVSQASILFFNYSTEPMKIELQSIELLESGDSTLASYMPFKVDLREGGDGKLLVAPMSSNWAEVTFRPGDWPEHPGGEPDFRKVFGRHRARVTFGVDHAQVESATVELMGAGGGPRLQFSATRLEFGEVGIGSQRVFRLGLSNVGSKVVQGFLQNLRIRAIRIDGKYHFPDLPDAWADEQFKIGAWRQGGGAYDPDMGLEPGESLEVEVIFEPMAVGAVEAELQVVPLLGGPHIVMLSGTGAELPPCKVSLLTPKLDFGVVEPGTWSAPLELALTNLDTENRCRIYSVRMNYEGGTSKLSFASESKSPYIYSGEWLTWFDLPKGVTRHFWVRASPTKEGMTDGNVELELNRGAEDGGSLITVALEAEGGTRCLDLGTAGLEFGTKTKSCSAEARDISITNVCDSATTLLGIFSTSGSPFHVFPSLTLPRTLLAPDVLPCSVAFAPMSAGTWGSVARFEYLNEGKRHSVLLPLSGEAVSDHERTERFVSPSRQQRDLLLVLDNSASVDRYHGWSRVLLERYVERALAAGIDYQIAITTTDPGEGEGTRGILGGEFYPLSWTEGLIVSSRQSKEEQIDRLGLMVDDIEKGFGSGTEWLIEPAIRALSPLHSLPGGRNHGFMREGSVLDIAIFSDARDQAPTELDRYVSFFRGLKPSGALRISAVIPTVSPGSCTYDGGPASASNMRVKTMVGEFDGALIDICKWWRGESASIETMLGTVLGEIGNFSFPLASLRDTEKPITVRVGGIALQKNVCWTYDPDRGARGAVVVAAECMPVGNTPIEVSYTARCPD